MSPPRTRIQTCQFSKPLVLIVIYTSYAFAEGENNRLVLTPSDARHTARASENTPALAGSSRIHVTRGHTHTLRPMTIPRRVHP